MDAELTKTVFVTITKQAEVHAKQYPVLKELCNPFDILAQVAEIEFGQPLSFSCGLLWGYLVVRIVLPEFDFATYVNSVNRALWMFDVVGGCKKAYRSHTANACSLISALGTIARDGVLRTKATRVLYDTVRRDKTWTVQSLQKMTYAVLVAPMLWLHPGATHHETACVLGRSRANTRFPSLLGTATMPSLFPDVVPLGGTADDIGEAIREVLHD